MLPTVWDVWTARMLEQAGFQALTIGSHPVADSIGGADGEQMAFDHYMAITRSIVEAVHIPVSIDVESGYGLEPADLMRRVIDTGAAGFDVEDTVHRDGGRVRSLQEHADFIGRLRDAADEARLPIVINGRTDALKHGAKIFDDPIGEATARASAMEEAGARAVYPVGIQIVEELQQLVVAVSVPVNVTVDPVTASPLGGFSELKAIGARRFTFGPKWQAAATTALNEQLTGWL